MKPLLRPLGVAALAVALMNASAGLCFCHLGPARPGAPPVPQGCCHGPETSGTAAVAAASACCHIESAESTATAAVAVQLAPPAPEFATLDHAHFTPRPAIAASVALPGASPPLFVLRI